MKIHRSYDPFSDFGDKNGYAGYWPSRWYINTVYVDYMEHIRPALDQCVAALTGYIIKWDVIQTSQVPDETGWCCNLFHIVHTCE